MGHFKQEGMYNPSNVNTAVDESLNAANLRPDI